MNNKQEQAITKFLAELGKTLRQKAMMEFEEHREFYPPNNGREEWEWTNDNCESMTQEEARKRIDDKVVEYIESMKEDLLQMARDR